MQARHRSSFSVMGTTASVHVNDNIMDETFDDVVQEIRTELERLEQMFSVYRADSEISRINRQELHVLDASREVIDVLDACTWLEQASQGCFTIRPSDRPLQINPTGFVKGWSAEYVSRLFIERGLQHWYLGIGGDYVLHGGLNNDIPWNIGITDPRDPEMLVAEISVDTGAIATSGTAERGQHLWDAQGNEVQSPFRSVTVTGPSLTWADAFATTVFVMGESGLTWMTQFDSYEVLPVR